MKHNTEYIFHLLFIVNYGFLGSDPESPKDYFDDCVRNTVDEDLLGELKKSGIEVRYYLILNSLILCPKVVLPRLFTLQGFVRL